MVVHLEEELGLKNARFTTHSSPTAQISGFQLTSGLRGHLSRDGLVESAKENVGAVDRAVISSCSFGSLLLHQGCERGSSRVLVDVEGKSALCVEVAKGR